MITAENDISKRITISETTERGGIPHRTGSYYSETLLTNYLNEDIYAVDYRNNYVTIPRHAGYVMGQRRIEVLCRTHAGDRKYQDHSNYEITPNKHTFMSIPYEVLREQPVFVEELNAVLCFKDQLTIARHPHSPDVIDDRIKFIKLDYDRKHSQLPFILTANDPTGKINELCIEVNGIICEVKVTHYTDEKDRVMLCLRDKPHDFNDFTVHETTFTELIKSDPRVWMLDRFRISSSRDWFEQIIEVERSKKPAYIEVTAVEKLIKQAGLEHAERNDRLVEVNKELVAKLRQSEANNESIISGEYLKKSTEVAYKKLTIEQEKLKYSDVEAKMMIESERLKLRKEIITTIGVIAKTLAVMIPLGLGIYKAVQASRS